eukprot:1178104-Prorocentrum_minimum.AAC.1
MLAATYDRFRESAAGGRSSQLPSAGHFPRRPPLPGSPSLNRRERTQCTFTHQQSSERPPSPLGIPTPNKARLPLKRA